MNMIVKKPNIFTHLQVSLETSISLPYEKEIFMSNRKSTDTTSILPWLGNCSEFALSKLVTSELCLASRHCRSWAWKQC